VVELKKKNIGLNGRITKVLKEQGESRRITCRKVRVSDKGRAKGILIGLKRVGKNKKKKTEEDEDTNRINEMNKM